MPIFEITKEDVYAPIEDKIKNLREVPQPTEYIYTPENPLPPVPVPEKPETAEGPSTTYSLEELNKLARGSYNASLKIEGTTPVAFRYFDGCEKDCVLCLQPLMRHCMKCDHREADYKQCSIVKGSCGHALHRHCVDNYEVHMWPLNECVVCRGKWVGNTEYPLYF